MNGQILEPNSDNHNGQVVEPNMAQPVVDSIQSDFMGGLRPPAPLSFEGNVSENWRRWRQKFEIYVTATNLTAQPNTRQVALLLHIIGDEALDKFNTFEISNVDKEDPNKVLTAFENYCSPKKNESVESYFFFTRNQKEDESLSEYILALKKLSASCGFGNLQDRLIKDKIVCGVRDSRLKERLLKEDNLTLDTCAKICQASELAENRLKSMENEKKVDAIKTNKNVNNQQGNLAKTYNNGFKNNSNNGFKNNSNNGYNNNSRNQNVGVPGGSQNRNQFQQSRVCNKCGKRHPYRQCPAFGKLCSKCNFQNHFASQCKNRNNINCIENESMDSLFIGSLHSNSDREKEWLQKIFIEDTKKYVYAKIDTGAHCNVISMCHLNKNVKIKETLTKITAYGGGNVNLLGKCYLSCKIKDKLSPIEFYVVKQTSPTILGLPSIMSLNIVKRLDTIYKTRSMENISNKYTKMLSDFKEVFRGIGCIKDYEYDLKIKPGAKGSIAACRHVPIMLREPLKLELQKMAQDDIITKVDGPTEWVNPLVITKKKDGSLRLCLDPSNLNNNILREHHHVPTFEDLCSNMAGASVFSTLDADKAFWQIKISERSSYYLTFSTPYGRYRFKRMPYGIVSATEVFQRIFQLIFEDLPGVEIYVDDIIVYGKNENEHDFRLKKVLERAKEYNITFNSKKCVIGTESVKYMGHIFSKEGIKLNDDRVKAIVEMKTPTCKKELETFLGMITYVNRFIPKLSEINYPLRMLTKKDSVWNWDANADATFKQLKNILTNAPVLKFFDKNKPVVMSVDASQYGLGAVLLQDNLPIAYASKRLNDTERNYAQIEKEALAIAFACHKFHQYISGKSGITVESDHRPLETIFKKPLSQCPARIQRIRLSTQIHDLNIKYKPGRELLLADALSRSYLDDDDNNFDQEIQLYVCVVEESLPISIDKKQEFIIATENDNDLQTLKNYIVKGWPKNVNLIPDNIKPYFKYADELNIINGLIFKGTRLIVPQTLRKDLLSKIHYCHLGIEKCKNRAREIVFWPFMNRDIENIVNNCLSCMKYRKENTKQPLILREFPNVPWETLGVDFFHFKNAEWLLLIDYFSKYVEVAKLNNITSTSVIAKLKSIFARHGIPATVFSDGGPPFNGNDIRNFSKEWGFEFKTSSPKFPKSNGMVERHVGTIKSMFKKLEEEGGDPYLALLEYRNTPIDHNLPSPNQLLFNRQTRGIVPIRTTNRNTPNYDENKKFFEEKRQKYKQYHDQTSQNLKPVAIGDTVYIRKMPGKPLEPATITNQCSRPRSYEVQLNTGGVLERNRIHIHPFNNSDDNSKAQNSNINVKNQDVPTNDSNTNVIPIREEIKSNETVTRSGRICSKPKNLSDYVTN